jgi:hypothetical protein
MNAVHFSGVSHSRKGADVAFNDFESWEPSFGASLSENITTRFLPLDRYSRFVTKDKVGIKATAPASE